MQRFGVQEGEKWNEIWLKVFARPAYKETGHWMIGSFRWHIFSYNYVPAATGQEADALLRAQTDEDLIGITDGVGSLKVFAVKREDLAGKIPGDFIVFPKDCLWTYAFTHEAPHFGPYFTWHPDKPKILAKRKNTSL